MLPGLSHNLIISWELLPFSCALAQYKPPLQGITFGCPVAGFGPGQWVISASIWASFSAPSSLPAGRPEGRNAFIFIRRCCVCLGHTRLVAISLWLNYKLWQSFRLECWDETTETSEVWSVFDRGVVGSNGRFVLHSPDLSLESWDFSFSLQFESSALSQFWVLSLQPSVDVANPLQRPCSDNAHAYKHENFQPKHLYGERTKKQQTEKVFHFAPT